MPVEIKELVIRAVIPPAVRDDEGTEDCDCEGGGSAPVAAQSALVADAVREVLRILRTSRER